MAPDEPGLTYKDSGVDIDAGEALVTRIAPAARATRRPGADADLGGFGGAGLRNCSNYFTRQVVH